MFSSRNKKDISIFQMKNAPYLLLCLWFTYYAVLHLCKNNSNKWSETTNLLKKKCIIEPTRHFSVDLVDLLDTTFFAQFIEILELADFYLDRVRLLKPNNTHVLFCSKRTALYFKS